VTLSPAHARSTVPVELAARLCDLFVAGCPLVHPGVMKALDFEVALQPCIRDVWRDNLLFNGDAVTGPDPELRPQRAGQTADAFVVSCVAPAARAVAHGTPLAPDLGASRGARKRSGDSGASETDSITDSLDIAGE
jgi:hypothetical protein